MTWLFLVCLMLCDLYQSWILFYGHRKVGLARYVGCELEILGEGIIDLCEFVFAIKLVHDTLCLKVVEF